MRTALILCGLTFMMSPIIMLWLDGYDSSDADESDLTNWLMGKPLEHIEMLRATMYFGVLTLAVGIVFRV